MHVAPRVVRCPGRADLGGFGPPVRELADIAVETLQRDRQGQRPPVLPRRIFEQHQAPEPVVRRQPVPAPRQNEDARRANLLARVQTQAKPLHPRPQPGRPPGRTVEDRTPLAGPPDGGDQALVAVRHVEERKRAGGGATALRRQHHLPARLNLGLERQERPLPANITRQMMQLDRLAVVAGAQLDIEGLHLLDQRRVRCAPILELQRPLDRRVTLEGGGGGAHAQTRLPVSPACLMDDAGLGVPGLCGALPVVLRGGERNAPVAERERPRPLGEGLDVLVRPVNLAIAGDNAGLGPISLVMAGAVSRGIHLERNRPRAFRQGDLDRRGRVGAAQHRRAKDALARNLDAELHGAPHPLGVRVVVYANDRPELHRVGRQTEDDLAVGMSPQPVLELPLADLHRRFDAGQAETQVAVLLTAKLHAHSRFPASQPAPRKDGAGPVLHLLNLGRLGHNGILRSIHRDILSAMGGLRASEEKDEQQSQEGFNAARENEALEHADSLASCPRKRNHHHSGDSAAVWGNTNPRFVPGEAFAQQLGNVPQMGGHVTKVSGALDAFPGPSRSGPIRTQSAPFGPARGLPPVRTALPHRLRPRAPPSRHGPAPVPLPENL